MPETAIDIDNLSVTIEQQPLFSGFNLTLAQGRKTTLIGRSGSGKSTLLRCLLGFVVPSAGAIRIFGQELTSHSVWQLRTRMAYVAQEPELGSAMVEGVLNQPFTFKANRHLRENRRFIPELLNQLQLPETILTKPITSLSGGERQRIALISALLLDRDILLLDEASSALDQEAKHAVIELLKQRDNLTILSVSHDQEWISLASDVVDLNADLQG